MCLRFFSSRRRHTRYSSDWSSDVCSSDLVSEEGPLLASKTPGKLRSEACEEGKMRKRRPWVFVLGILMLLSGSTFGQVATTGKIAGMVTDSSGAAVPNATVTVKGTSLMAERTTGTGADGAYLFDLLPLGTYEVTVAAKGFKGFSETGIVLTAGFTATVNAKLQVGEVTQVVRVEGVN